MEAHNRRLEEWYNKVKLGEIRLPRFQRFEAWDRQRICSLTETVIQNLPLGITLVLEVGENEQFISRCLNTAPERQTNVHEHLLDGQQRLTALWRVLHNNYENETYFVYLKEFDRYTLDAEREDRSVDWETRYLKNNARYPLWCDDPYQCLERGLIPTQLLRPELVQAEIDNWIEEATALLRKKASGEEGIIRYYELQKRLSGRIKDLQTVVATYNLPYLSLPSQTDKTVALNVFINMNTNSKPLSQYDIIVAEVESLMGQSIHDLEAALGRQYPEVARYSPLADQILTASALLQGRLPNIKRSVGHGQATDGGELGDHGNGASPDGRIPERGGDLRPGPVADERRPRGDCGPLRIHPEIRRQVRAG